MLKQLYTRWWKVLGALLVIGTIIAGIGIPVGPGIKNISPEKAEAGTTANIHITAYNAHFQSATTNQIWLREDEFFICPEDIQVINEDQLIATVNVPAGLSEEFVNTYYDIIINNDVDGTFLLHNIMGVTGEASAGAMPASCEAAVVSNESEYISFPYRVVLYETIRNLFFHVPMWFTMTFLLLLSFIFSIAYLAKMDLKYDILAAQMANVAVLFGVLGFFTGALWGNFTWGNLNTWLIQDAKILGAIIGILMYLAYFILRGSFNDEEKKSRIGAVYNIFAFAMFIVFIYVMPRMTATLHPGSGGNPGFSSYDLDQTMRLVFYPAVLGWILVGLWIASIRVRMKFLENSIYIR